MKPILCLDFDGVIHSYTSGWKGADVIPDPPVEGAEEFIVAASEFFDVQVFSSRSNEEGGISAMLSYIGQHLPKALSFVGFPLSKPPAFIGLDDRVLTFNGEWPSIDTLCNFKPWNKR